METQSVQERSLKCRPKFNMMSVCTHHQEQTLALCRLCEKALVQGIHVDVKPTFDARRITKHCPRTEVEPVVNQCDR